MGRKKDKNNIFYFLFQRNFKILRDWFDLENLKSQIRPAEDKLVMLYTKRKAIITNVSYRVDNTLDIQFLIDGFEYEVQRIKEYKASHYFFNKPTGITVYQLANGKILYVEPKDYGYMEHKRLYDFKGSENIIKGIDDLSNYSLFLDILYFQYKFISLVFLTLTFITSTIFLMDSLTSSNYILHFFSFLVLTLLSCAIMLNRFSTFSSWNNFIHRLGHYPSYLELKRRT